MAKSQRDGIIGEVIIRLTAGDATRQNIPRIIIRDVSTIFPNCADSLIVCIIAKKFRPVFSTIMANPQLTKQQREDLFAPLFRKTKEELERLAAEDADLLFALRRKLAKELVYLERGRTSMRVKLKAQKRKEQDGLCAICMNLLPEKGAELDRFEAKLGYTVQNTRLVHHECHIEDQRKKKYTS